MPSARQCSKARDAGTAMARTAELTLEAIAHRGDLTAEAERLSAVEGWRTVVAIGTQWFMIAVAISTAVLTHHPFPSVPWYDLPELAALLSSDPQFRKRAHVSHGYFGRNGVMRGEMLSA